MKELTRTLRTSAKTGLSVDSMLAAALLSELISPSRQLWLVSPWITDVEVIDNRHGNFDSLFGDVPPSSWRLSDVLLRLSGAGTEICVVTRADPHNDLFLRRMESADPKRLHVWRDPDVHEKTLCGQDWLLDGSMNFTVRGMAKNDESVTYKMGGPGAGQARLDLARRWRNGA
ncbi:phospholipase D-like domain-containing protein DpdK [Kitasatospora sp. NPDC085879]|uniref:phospholipase D-like domain-containing protein DpdK n=1 Tax=Kitasatospora sp. NPDC085879 TaxID=3154769 RepID=UPI003444AEC9